MGTSTFRGTKHLYLRGKRQYQGILSVYTLWSSRGAGCSLNETGYFTRWTTGLISHRGLYFSCTWMQRSEDLSSNSTHWEHSQPLRNVNIIFLTLSVKLGQTSSCRHIQSSRTAISQQCALELRVSYNLMEKSTIYNCTIYYWKLLFRNYSISYIISQVKRGHTFW